MKSESKQRIDERKQDEAIEILNRFLRVFGTPPKVAEIVGVSADTVRRILKRQNVVQNVVLQQLRDVAKEYGV